MWLLWQILIVLSLFITYSLTENKTVLKIISILWIIESLVYLTLFSVLQIFQILLITATTILVLQLKK